jgi:hypothetical protein
VTILGALGNRGTGHSVLLNLLTEVLETPIHLLSTLTNSLTFSGGAAISTCVVTKIIVAAERLPMISEMH